MANTNEATRRLGIEHPIVLGPFGGGMSSVRLAAAVSNLGGLGSFGAHSLAPDDIVRVTREIRAETSRPFAMNLWVSDHDRGGLVNAPWAISWNSSHPTSGCDAASLRATGGDGLFYCFAAK